MKLHSLLGKRAAPLALVVTLLAAGCRRAPDNYFQGYLEGDFVHVGAPLGGRLEKLHATKGARVPAGAPLFVLEHAAELAEQRQAADRLAAAEARLADLRKGARSSELDTIAARLRQARAAEELSRIELQRIAKLLESRVAAASDYDQARFTHERNAAAVAELEATLETARLGARADLITAAEAEVAAATAAKSRADWAVTEKMPSAPRDALVFDTLYREGEFVAAGRPVVSLLPPENIKVRFFVSESVRVSLSAGDLVRVTIASRGEPIDARIAYLSPNPEYTPPVLYNRDNRAKLVFLVEAALPPEIARDLHPGQPVEVTLVR